VICHFGRSGLPAKRLPGSPAGGPAGPAGPEPLQALLESLRGHQVTLLVGNREISGKLLTVSPVVMVAGPTGQATAITGEIQAVQF
jgi:hypothetical protein